MRCAGRKSSVWEYYEKLHQTARLLINMSRLETFEREISAVMETLVEAAVTELSRLLDKCVVVVQHRYPPPPETLTAVTDEEEERQRFNKDIMVGHTLAQPNVT